MATEDRKIKIEKIDGSDFRFWNVQIEDYLYGKDLYQLLTEEKPKDMSKANWSVLDRKILGVVCLLLSHNIYIQHCKGNDYGLLEGDFGQHV